MKAIETSGKIDKKGLLRLNKPLKTKDKNVKVIILLEEDEINDETYWLSVMAKNPAFNFLSEEGEDLYTLSDGKAFND